MQPEFCGIEKRLDELRERLSKLEPLRQKIRPDFDDDPYLRDIVERNLEVAAQCCIDICHRIVALEKARKPTDAHEAILRMGELGVLETRFAQRFAPISGFRNILVHEYIGLNWDEIYSNLQRLEELREFAEAVGLWMRQRQ
ncbi:MAG: type VII toxin-antitoxin system HepT family RNase toxin [Thermodesulfobacteriota bacterium]